MEYILQKIARKCPEKFIMNLYNSGNKEKNPSQIARETKLTYSHCMKVQNDLEDMKLVNSVKVGRTRPTKLTVKGIRIAKLISEIGEILNVN